MRRTTAELIDLCPALLAGPMPRLGPRYRLSAMHPVNGGEGEAFFESALRAPLRAAFPGGEERTDIALTGEFGGQHWLARSGHLAGIFAAALFGIPPTGRVAFTRYGRFDRFIDSQPVETILLLDLPDLMMQAGVWTLAAPLGPPIVAPGPASRDGVASRGDAAEGQRSLALVEAMIGGLMRYDGHLKNMNMRDFWSPDFWWFGPAPIGTFKGFDDYERGHAKPFLTAFPDRVGGNHRARIGERNYIASTGWPSITATHAGGDWLGLPASQRAVTMRVMDFWRRQDDRLVENWIMIDIPDLLKQLGIDIFADLASHNARI